MALDALDSWTVAFVAAVINDVLDIFAVGSVPIAGDIVDAITIFVLFPTIGRYDIVNAAEFVPGADPLPTFTLTVLVAYLLRD